MAAADEIVPGIRTIRPIGTGAGSRIVLAMDLRTGKEVAVKHVVRETADDDRFIEQVETEYHVTHKLDHAHLRRGFSVHRVKKLFYTKEIMLVMEYVDGLPLETARPNRLNTFITIFQKVAAGLDALHEAGFVHADIKPINIMLGKSGLLKIIDFGQACKMGHRKERVQGTPDYIAPEQVRRLQLDRRTDVFNLGATMYWVLTSEKYPTALQGSDARGGHRLVTADKVLAPIELNDKIPLSLSNLVMECCKENPAERPADMKQVGSRLAAIQNLWKKQLDQLRSQPKVKGEPAADRQAEPLAAAGQDEGRASDRLRINEQSVRFIEEEE